MDPKNLSVEWRAEARRFQELGLEPLARVLERCAEKLERVLTEWEVQPLSVSKAAAESGYSQDHLRALVREGAIPDSRPPGSRGEIRIRRCDLPRKPAVASGVSSTDQYFASRMTANQEGTSRG